MCAFDEAMKIRSEQQKKQKGKMTKLKSSSNHEMMVCIKLCVTMTKAQRYEKGRLSKSIDTKIGLMSLALITI